MVLNRKAESDVLDAVDMAVMCQDYHCLPGPGGLLDQDARDVWILGIVASAQAEYRRLPNRLKRKEDQVDES